MRKQYQRLSFYAGLVFLMGVCGVLPAYASTPGAYVHASAQTEASTFTYGGIGLDYVPNIGEDWDSSSAYVSKSASSGPGYANAYATAGFGSLHAASSGYGTMYGSDENLLVSSGNANSYAEFYDIWTIGVPDWDGIGVGTGTITYALSLSGGLNGVHYVDSPYYSAGADLYVDGSVVSSIGTVYDWTTDVNRTVTITKDFTYGQPFSVSMGIGTRASGVYWWGGTSFSNFSDTAELTGITVKDNNGEEIKNYAFLAASGYDYDFLKQEPVVTPEPVSMVLFGLGGAVMAFSRRRVKREG